MQTLIPLLVVALSACSCKGRSGGDDRARAAPSRPLPYEAFPTLGDDWGNVDLKAPITETLALAGLYHNTHDGSDMIALPLDNVYRDRSFLTLSFYELVPRDGRMFNKFFASASPISEAKLARQVASGNLVVEPGPMLSRRAWQLEHVADLSSRDAQVQLLVRQAHAFAKMLAPLVERGVGTVHMWRFDTAVEFKQGALFSEASTAFLERMAERLDDTLNFVTSRGIRLITVTVKDCDDAMREPVIRPSVSGEGRRISTVVICPNLTMDFDTFIAQPSIVL